MDDSTILRLLRASPEEGCAALLETYGALIHGITARALSGSPQDAEECTADVLAAAWRHADELSRSGAPLRAWLIVTARNAAFDALRRSGRRAEMPLDEALLPADGEPPESSALEDAVETLVAQMPQPDREIFMRKYWLLQPSREIADALGLAVQTVNTRLFRGRERLRRALEQQMGTEWEESEHEQSV